MGRQTAQPSPENVNHQHQNQDGEWTRVERKHKGGKHDGFKDKSNDPFSIRTGRRARVFDFDRVMKNKAFSFFFTNFPETWDSGALWKMFSRYGNVVDVYIEFKRTKKGSRFGFVRFINIGDVVLFERKLKTILIGEVPLVINLAKFYKSEGAGPKTLLLVDRVKISINEDNAARSILDSCTIKYVGGLSFLLEWNSKDTTTKSMEENLCWMQQLFNDVKPWEENRGSHGRLMWLVIEGLPILGRNLAVVKTITNRFRKVLEVRRLNLDANVLGLVKILILTNSIKDIMQPIDVVLNNRSYPVRIFKDPSLNSKFLKDLNGKYRDRSDEESLFEEEYIGPFMEVYGGNGEPAIGHGDGDSFSNNAVRHGEVKEGANEKSTLFQYPRNGSKVSNVAFNEEDNYAVCLICNTPKMGRSGI
ncbi:nucleotide-binding alpha-beta plait domain-containing protein [Tanacetum coccineum]